MTAAITAATEPAVKPDFNKLCRDTMPRLKWLAMKYMRNDEEAEDVLQDALMKAYKAWDRFRGDASFTTWMYRIVTNVALNRLQQMNRQSRVVIAASAVAVDENGDEPGQSWVETACHMDTPEAILQAKETQEMMARTLSQLQSELPALHEAFMGHTVEHRSYVEMAEEAELPIGTMRSRVHRAKEALKRAHLAAVGEDYLS
ncbi:sigma-70 family RNA polymerase sigma factor [Ramlibacter alkalitolerans]|uniref:Sigma-70 family RNA polymerase sigma factor n=1 Tax=Ramlibacter alkalitolerans TaxID=2039631 RepID=A0ABS1JUK8_9BURK|nr:sigma-70 family RNA polymerase sigma factor [Ramlibacter alkalitolerans]MBL0427811.1 sigma-70 family RNA polymerase sigma factor [Ramlibacter alkalitolerans]